MTPPFSSEDQIDRIGRAFLDLSLPKPEWTHAARDALIRQPPPASLHEIVNDLTASPLGRPGWRKAA
jgi:hypothetical protein